MFKNFDKNNVNWVGVGIRVAIILVVLLFATWLVYLIFFKDTDKILEENLQKMREVAVEYFTDDKLPTEVNTTQMITLQEMIDNDLIDKLVDSDEKQCNQKQSFAEVTKKEEDYTLHVYLLCGGKEKSTTETFSLSNKVEEDSGKKDDDVSKKEEPKKEEQVDKNKGKKLYYEYAKVNYSYGPWIQGNKTGDGIETKTEAISYSKYCKTVNVKYYSATYVPATVNNGYNYNYELKLTNVPGTALPFKINTSYFTSVNDYQTWINFPNSNLSVASNALEKATKTLKDPNMFQRCALKQNNFRFSVSDPYKKGNAYYVKVNITVNNTNGVVEYRTSSVGAVYFVPIYFAGKYIDSGSCITDLTSRQGNYSGYSITSTWNQNINYYRVATKTIDKGNTKWSTEKSLEGYEATGKSEWR